MTVMMIVTRGARQGAAPPLMTSHAASNDLNVAHCLLVNSNRRFGEGCFSYRSMKSLVAAYDKDLVRPGCAGVSRAVR